MTYMQAVIHDVDYDMLWHQKMLLLELRDSTKTTEAEALLLNGLVHFLDAFQDAVVNDGVLPEQRVFGIGSTNEDAEDDPETETGEDLAQFYGPSAR
jgi:hypothetical protein